MLLFAIQGDAITADPLTVARIALPLLVYFVVMWVLGFAVGRAMSLGYPKTATMAFTVASNDFELAIAVAVGVWGATSGQALAGVVGPLIEVPVLVGLVYVALWLRRRWWPNSRTARDRAAPVRPADQPEPLDHDREPRDTHRHQRLRPHGPPRAARRLGLARPRSSPTSTSCTATPRRRRTC